MEITKDALLRIVKAARLSMSVAENMQRFLTGKGRTWADEVEGELEDALFLLCKDHIPEGKDFSASQTMLLLNSDMSDSAVADWIVMMDKIRTKMPSPNLMSKEETKELYRKNGGYAYTPEGEFT